MTGGTIAATIAHEIRQPLTAIVASADAGLRYLDRSTPHLDKAKEALRRIAFDGHRAADVVESIRATFKSDVRNRTALDVNELIKEALALERGALQKHGVLVQAEPSQRLPDIRGDRVQLQQVLLNLAMNGIEAMAAVDGRERLLEIAAQPDGPEEIRVSVRDTGPGLGVEQREHVFDAFYTTKMHGMGMGLAISRSIVETHGGRLWVERNHGHGENFQFTLPTREHAAR
jgi:C4-dicarboxylate-specific signal transduction histidine kinase